MRKLTCYAWGKPGDWEAICVDLDIAAQGASFEEVREDLQLAVEDFLDYAAELPEIERRAILSVKAPWPLRARLWFLNKSFIIPSAFNPLPKGNNIERAAFEVRLA